MSGQDGERRFAGMARAPQGGATFAGDYSYCPHWVSTEEDLGLDGDGKSPFMHPDKFTVDDLRYHQHKSSATRRQRQTGFHV